MDDKFEYISISDNKITLSVDYNYWLKSLDNNSLWPTNQNSMKVNKLF